MCKTMNELEKIVADYRGLKALKEQVEEELKAVEREIIGYMDVNEKLSETEVKFKDNNACCVIMASDGYTAHYEKGFEMSIPADVLPNVYVAGAKLEDGKLLTNGGRVLGVTAIADTLKDAICESYKLVKTISFENAFYRNDIGKRALEAEEK